MGGIAPLTMTAPMGMEASSKEESAALQSYHNLVNNFSLAKQYAAAQQRLGEHGGGGEVSGLSIASVQPIQQPTRINNNLLQMSFRQSTNAYRRSFLSNS